VTGWFPLVVLGGFGPASAAAVMLRLGKQPLRPWLRRLLSWRVRPRFYAYALLLPAALYGLVNLALQVLGADVDWSLLPGRLPGYLLALLLTATLFGGLEEPGWRGYALPRLQARHTPFRATLLLGLAWGVWHVPLYGPAGFVVPLVLAFFYTWLYNRTGSVLLCVLLHGSFTAAQDELLLTADSVTVDAVILGIYVAAAAAVVLLTRGRLGVPAVLLPSAPAVPAPVDAAP
jgi:membrane protease YdiL (CAAX protease family)